ncbi:hypothetical protein SAMN04488539_2164 [Corynebacterium timonense]|uniref:Uncharacterized protein n=1 Tax=Corynebacterium timonense TaxID=441500 RepID=A0A1H1U7F5_9CORY|nr:hypothetical protein SAMN04488539_2164 [Corynebacterium timonense]
MAAGPNHIDPTAYLDELLTQASPDQTHVRCCRTSSTRSLSTQADSVCGADYATVSDTRTKDLTHPSYQIISCASRKQTGCGESGMRCRHHQHREWPVHTARIGQPAGGKSQVTLDFTPGKMGKRVHGVCGKILGSDPGNVFAQPRF